MGVSYEVLIGSMSGFIVEVTWISYQLALGQQFGHPNHLTSTFWFHWTDKMTDGQNRSLNSFAHACTGNNSPHNVNPHYVASFPSLKRSLGMRIPTPYLQLHKNGILYRCACSSLHSIISVCESVHLAWYQSYMKLHTVLYLQVQRQTKVWFSN